MKKSTKLFYLISTDTPGNANSECSTSGISTLIPAYIPPLFLVTKQAISATKVSSATAHMIPMNQLLVEILPYAPVAPANT